MSQYRRLFIALAIFMSGVALIPYVSLSSEPFGWQMYPDVYEPDLSTLTINHTTGRPGSFFTLTGSDFPPNDTATILVNGNELGSMSTGNAGGPVFLLSTTNSDAGFYLVTVSVNPSASIGFLLDPESPLRMKEGTGQEFAVPPGIALTEFIYLPIILR